MRTLSHAKAAKHFEAVFAKPPLRGEKNLLTSRPLSAYTESAVGVDEHRTQGGRKAGAKAHTADVFASVTDIQKAL